MKKLIVFSLLCVIITGCSTLQTTVKPDVSWSSFSLVEISLADDRWNLLPLLAARLTDHGYSIVPSHTDAADLRATLQVADGSTLSETGATVAWPRDLSLQLFDAKTGAELAHSRYQLASTQSPKHGLDLILADLHKQIRRASSDTTSIRNQPSPVQQTGTSTRQNTPPKTASAPQATPVEKTVTVSEPANTETQESQPALKEEKTDRSPWRPRFQGWALPDRDD